MERKRLGGWGALQRGWECFFLSLTCPKAAQSRGGENYNAFGMHRILLCSELMHAFLSTLSIRDLGIG